MDMSSSKGKLIRLDDRRSDRSDKFRKPSRHLNTTFSARTPSTRVHSLFCHFDITIRATSAGQGSLTEPCWMYLSIARTLLAHLYVVFILLTASVRSSP